MNNRLLAPIATFRLLVSAPRAGGQAGHIVDLGLPTHDAAAAIAQAHDNVVQSMMLLDDTAQVRVRKSELAACRTVVAQDGHDRLLV
ncbi:MAG: hypothetical protein EOO62_24025, partial [Hymenobacter sp.]